MIVFRTIFCRYLLPVEVVRKAWKEAARVRPGIFTLLDEDTGKSPLSCPGLIGSQRRNVHGILVANVLDIKLMER